MRLACAPVEVRGEAPQFLGDEGVARVGSGASAMFGLVLQILLSSHGGPVSGALVNAARARRFRLTLGAVAPCAAGSSGVARLS